MTVFEKKAPSPLQITNGHIWENGKLLGAMQNMRNKLWKLSPQTRDAWRVFKQSAWEDVAALKRQREMYCESNSEILQEIHVANRAASVARAKERRETSIEMLNRKLKQKIGSIYSDCRKCKETGITDRLGDLIAYCSCPKGIEAKKLNPPKPKEVRISAAEKRVLAKHPNWTISDDGEFAICSDCKAAFVEKRLHGCTEAEDFQWSVKLK